MVRRAAVIAASLLLAACSVVPKGEAVPVNKIAEGDVEGVSSMQVAVAVTSSEKWWTEWQVIHQADDVLPAPPVIDFDKEHVVIVGSQLGKGNYVMTVTGISLRHQVAHVDLQVQDISNCSNSGGAVLPFQAYTVPVTVKRVLISEHDSTLSCR